MTVGAQIDSYVEPATLAEAAQALNMGPATLVAGGTLVVREAQAGRFSYAPTLINLHRVDEMRGIELTDAGLRIGALTRLRDINEHAVIRESAAVLAQTALHMASTQVRNLGTIGGNLCWASPSADLTVSFLVLDAEVELISASRRSNYNPIIAGERISYRFRANRTRCERNPHRGHDPPISLGPARGLYEIGDPDRPRHDHRVGRDCGSDREQGAAPRADWTGWRRANRDSCATNRSRRRRAAARRSVAEKRGRGRRWRNRSSQRRASIRVVPARADRRVYKKGARWPRQRVRSNLP